VLQRRNPFGRDLALPDEDAIQPVTLLQGHETGISDADSLP
jgi:hypothetical protein